MIRVLFTAAAAVLALTVAAHADTGPGRARAEASPLPGECQSAGRTIVYRPLPGGGYEARTINCPAVRTPYERLREVSGATNLERLKSITMQPPGTRDNSMGRSTPP